MTYSIYIGRAKFEVAGSVKAYKTFFQACEIGKTLNAPVALVDGATGEIIAEQEGD